MRQSIKIYGRERKGGMEREREKKEDMKIINELSDIREIARQAPYELRIY